MKHDIQLTRGELSIGTSPVPGQPLGAPPGRKLSRADRLGFVLFALGLLALSGVLLAVGAILLAALAAGGLLFGGAVALWRPARFAHGRLAPGEVAPDGLVLPAGPDAAKPHRPSSLPVVRGD